MVRRLDEAIVSPPYKNIESLRKAFTQGNVVNWKSHADGRVPTNSKTAINVWNFNKDDKEPLRPKYYDATINGDTLEVEWVCQEEPYSLTGMEREFKRFLKNAVPFEVTVKVNVSDRSGYSSDSFVIKHKPSKKESIRTVKEEFPYPANWTADTDIHQVFSTLDQTDTKNPGAIEDLYGFVEYDVGWVDAEEDIIQIRAVMRGKGYGSYETFYVYPSYTKNVYLIDTEELGTRTVDNATDVWDIMSTCLRKQLKDTSSASVYEESKKGSFNMVRRLNEEFDDYDEDEYDEDDYNGQEDIVASYNVSYEEEDGSTYDDGGQFHICFNPYTEKYSWRSDALDMSSDDTFDTEEEAYEDAEYAHQPDDGSTLVIY